MSRSGSQRHAEINSIRVYEYEYMDECANCAGPEALEDFSTALSPGPSPEADCWDKENEGSLLADGEHVEFPCDGQDIRHPLARLTSQRLTPAASKSRFKQPQRSLYAVLQNNKVQAFCSSHIVANCCS
jgi:hypothetical protein